MILYLFLFRELPGPFPPVYHVCFRSGVPLPLLSFCIIAYYCNFCLLFVFGFATIFMSLGPGPVGVWCGLVWSWGYTHKCHKKWEDRKEITAAACCITLSGSAATPHCSGAWKIVKNVHIKVFTFHLHMDEEGVEPCIIANIHPLSVFFFFLFTGTHTHVGI